MSEAAQAAARQAGKAARSLASEMGDQILGMMDRQVEVSADLGVEMAEAVRAAGDRLEETASPVAGLLQSAADWIEDWSETVRSKSAGELFDDAQDFVRRRPAVVFGAAAATGFLIYRLMSLPSDDYDSSDEQDYEDEFESASLDQQSEADVSEKQAGSRRRKGTGKGIETADSSEADFGSDEAAR
jgi:ElaB/YqjD/DUF883 family membrane-anchored ribosome-binding protein